MRPETKAKFNTLQLGMAKKYAVESVVQMFSVSVPQAISLVDAIQQSSAFLAQISAIPVTDSKGEIITMHAPASVAGRTDTSGIKERVPQRVGTLSNRTYEVKKTNFDTAITYTAMDAYARFSDFNARLLGMILRRQALDRLLIGWYGNDCAADTDRDTYPLLQDVNHGWFYDLATYKPANYVVADENEKLKLGRTGDWKNLDHLAFDLLSLIPEEHRTGRETVIVGRKVIAWESGKIFAAHGQTPTEKVNFEFLAKTYGGMPATMPAGFPDNGVMVTDPANLQLYWQDSAVRRQLIDNPKKDQVEHFQSANECYRIGDLDAIAAVKAADIEFVDLPDDSIPVIHIGNFADMPVPTSVAVSNIAETPIPTEIAINNWNEMPADTPVE